MHTYNPIKKQYTGKCTLCGKSFTTEKRQQKYCSEACAKKAHNTKSHALRGKDRMYANVVDVYSIKDGVGEGKLDSAYKRNGAKYPGETVCSRVRWRIYLRKRMNRSSCEFAQPFFGKCC